MWLNDIRHLLVSWDNQHLIYFFKYCIFLIFKLCFFLFIYAVFHNWRNKTKLGSSKSIKLGWINLKCDYNNLPPRRNIGMTHERSHRGLIESARESSQLECKDAGICVGRPMHVCAQVISELAHIRRKKPWFQFIFYSCQFIFQKKSIYRTYNLSLWKQYVSNPKGKQCENDLTER